MRADRTLIGLLVLAFAVLAHACFPRYEAAHEGRGGGVVDRWTGEICSWGRCAAFGEAPTPPATAVSQGESMFEDEPRPSLTQRLGLDPQGAPAPPADAPTPRATPRSGAEPTLGKIVIAGLTSLLTALGIGLVIWLRNR